MAISVENSIFFHHRVFNVRAEGELEFWNFVTAVPLLYTFEKNDDMCLRLDTISQYQ